MRIYFNKKLLLVPVIIFFSCKKKEVPAIVIDQNPITEIPKTIVWEISDKITWADEFEKDGAPNMEIWNYDIGGGGWGNNEKQYYSKEADNVLVKDGMLTITAKLNKDFPNYTSTRMVTKGKKDFLFGKIEVRALLPKGKGTWPAIWTLATKSNYGDAYWPDNGELDIMEHVGYDQGRIHSNIHTKAFNHSIGTNKGNSSSLSDVSDKFHVYTMEWLPNSVLFLIDGVKNFEFKRELSYGWREWPFDKQQHLLLNLAIGGNWGGAQGIDDSIFPQKFVVDYVRYYEAIQK